MSQTSKNDSALVSRLTQYAVAAAAVPVASASGAIVSETFPSPIVLSNGASTGINFGDQFGSVFNFTFRRYTFTFTSYFGDFEFRSVANAVVNFNYYYNTAPSAPSFASFVNINPTLGFYGYNDPARFGPNQNLSTAAGLNFTTFDYSRGTNHDLFNRNLYFSATYFGGYSFYSGTYGAWGAGQRGFLLFRFDGAGGDHYGYFDISIASDGESMRIHGWAFNDQVDGGISTIALPAPGSVGLACLALGAAGIRRKRRSA